MQMSENQPGAAAKAKPPTVLFSKPTMDDGNWPSPETLERKKRKGGAPAGAKHSLQLQPSGDPSAVAPPVPIPNTEVKRCSPDDSVSIGYAKVGRRQSYAPFLAIKQGTGRLFVPKEARGGH
jgi:hypothetical protein